MPFKRPVQLDDPGRATQVVKFVQSMVRRVPPAVVVVVSDPLRESACAWRRQHSELVAQTVDEMQESSVTVPYVDIAMLLGLPQGSGDMDIQRALVKMRPALGGYVRTRQKFQTESERLFAPAFVALGGALCAASLMMTGVDVV
jgi:hypothetical protein